MKRYISRKFISTIIILLFGVSMLINCTGITCENGNQTKKDPIAKLKFINKIHDLGDVANDTLLVIRYKFINTSNEILKINYVNPACICTAYTLSNNSILPNDTAYIELKFNTKEKYGKQKIYTIVSANTEVELYKLTLEANIL